MNISSLLAELNGRGVGLEKDGDELIIRCEEDALNPELIDSLRANKSDILKLIDSGTWPLPPLITPAMLPLVDLTQEEIDRIMSRVPGGASNVRDIYPLAPLQEGILFQHLMEPEGDPYLLPTLLSFDTRARLENYLKAMQAVVDRHDILRTAVLWEDLSDPVQVVLRKVALEVADIELNTTKGDVSEQLYARFDPHHFRIDVHRAPLLRIYVAYDGTYDRWLMLQHLHHLAGDHTTLEVMQEEIEAHLLEEQDGLPAPLPFRNLVAQARLDARQKEEQESFFRKMLGDINEPTAPFGLIDVRNKNDRIEDAHLQVDTTLAKRMRATARRLGLSTASICHVAWAQVLSKTSGREDVVFGTVLFGRMQGGSGADRVMGMFINTLPIRIEVGNKSVEASVREAHVLLAELLRHEHASLALAQRCSGVPAPTPVFSALLNYRHSPGFFQAPSDAQRKAREGIQLLRGEERTNYPVTLSVEDFGVEMGLTVQALSSIGPMYICQYMHTALEALIQALETEPSVPIYALQVLPAAQKRQILYDWNDTDTNFSGDLCIHHFFEQQVERSPTAVAIYFEGESLNYYELNRRANQLAHHLLTLGVGPDQRVAICVERGPTMIVGLLAILKAGGVYVPLDPAYPAERLRFILEDAAPVLLLTQSPLLEAVTQLFASSTIPVLDLKTESVPWNNQPETNPDPAVVGLTSQHLAYIIYTSGSTGRPKGVMVEHRAAANTLLHTSNLIDVQPDDVMATTASIAFDISILETMTAWLRGGCTAIIDPKDILDDQLLVDRLRRVTILHAVPALMAQIVEIFESRDVDSLRLRTLLTGGDSVPRSLLKRLAETFPNRTIRVLYGPTEAAMICTNTARVGEYDSGAHASIGRPIANTKIYILDSHGEPVPVGVAGELYIGGTGVARGYLNQPELTAERFLIDPFSHEPGTRMYRTGDQGRWLSDGSIEFLGRNDNQVKIRGYRIELGEIEARLAEYPDVRDAVVIVREDEPGQKQLIAYYTLVREDRPPEVAQLRAHLVSALPEYMIPTAYVVLDMLPLTPNGKLDRKALPAPAVGAYAAQTYEPPHGQVEASLAAIWCDLLKLKKIGRHDNFFSLGGHSLLAVRAISKIRQALSIEVAISNLFAYPVLIDFARTVETFNRSELPPITCVQRIGPLPLSFAQQRLWFLAQMEGGNEAYRIPFQVSLHGRLDAAALRRALDRILMRHEILRTTFIFINEQPMQNIGSTESNRFCLLEYDLRQHPEAKAELKRLRELEETAPFDLEQGPLIRGRLVRLAEDEHALLVSMHHIVSDGWSMDVLLNELSVLYSAYLNGKEDPLSSLEIQYADYAVWQRKWIEGRILQQQAAYWKKNLAGAPALLEIPTDHSRPSRQSYEGAFARLALDQQLTAALKQLSERHGTTLFMTVLTAWAILLSRLSGQLDVVVGSPVANRQRAEVENLIGFFVNTLALRIDLSGSPSVGEVLGRVKTQALAAQENQDIPFENVVELLQPVRSLSHSPLFQVMFAWQNDAPTTLRLPGLEQTTLRGSTSSVAKFDLALSLQEVDEGIVGGLEYATSLFEPSTIERYLANFSNLLSAMTADDAEAVDRLPMITDQERHQLLYQWNETEVDFSTHACIHQLFEDHAANAPDAIAVVYEDVELSYGELNRRANQLAHHLRDLGVRPDIPVALCVERGFEMVTALLAILKAGGAYVPLDASYPSGRLSFMLNDSAAAVLLIQSHLKDLFPGQGETLRVISLDAESDLWSDLPDTNPDSAAVGLTSQNLAYIIYTSGSTGRPKGVVVEHRGLANLAHAQISQFHVSQNSRVTLFASPSFDASIFEMVMALGSNAALHIPTKDQRQSGAEFFPYLVGHSITHTTLPPAMFQGYTDLGQLAVQTTLILAGDAPPSRLVQNLVSQGKATIVNAYGPTECTVCATTWVCPLQSDVPSIIPIGRPIANVKIYILDSHGEPVPVGVAGELYIGGAGVARGYLNQPDLTAEKFLLDPFSHEPGACMYRTGDLGRWLSDGNIEFLGRNDNQIKIRGFRIEFGEIEAKLTEHPGVQEAVVIAREDEPGDRRLVAYYSLMRDSEPIAPEQLRAHLVAALPEYMIPAAYVVLDELPLTPNGKLDRKRLPLPEIDAYATQSYEAPRGKIETILAAIWADLLALDKVGRNDNFFSLGGHSLLVVRVISKIRQTLNIEVAISELFVHPVLADFSKTVEKANRSELPSITRIERAGPLPLSFAQQRLWFLAQMEGGSEAYHIPFRIRLQGSVDTSVLHRALDRVLTRHEILRTTFHFINEQPAQTITSAETSRFHLREVDLRHHNDARSELERIVEEEAHASFDLEHGPLIRGQLVRLAMDEHALLITMHHIVSDGWSMGVLLSEISALYNAYLSGEEDPLSNLEIQYADYAVWQRKWIEGSILQQQADYWKKNLTGAPALLELPTDRPRPAQRSYEGAFAKLTLDTKLTTGLRELSRRHGTTLYMTLLAGWALLLFRLSGQEDVVVGSPVANRRRAEIEGLVGFFVNTLALRINLAGVPSVGELLGRVKAQVLAGQENQDIPFDQVVEIMRPIRSLSLSPLFQVMFAWQSGVPIDLELSGIKHDPLESSLDRAARFDLTLSVQETNDTITGELIYTTSQFQQSTIERYLRYFTNLLTAMVADDSEVAGRLPILSEDERQCVLYEWNATKVGYPRDKYVHYLFEEQVAKDPNAVALVFDDASLDYSDLNSQANRLAHHLIALGVNPDDRVAVCVERGFGMMVALLAILKAGGAYVPLDPAYPADRLRFMLEDSAPIALLTQASLLPLFTACDEAMAILDVNAPNAWQNQTDRNPDSDSIGLKSNHLAYVIYTSGSTGIPKGVLVEHRNLTNYLLWSDKQYYRKLGTGSPLVHSIGFDGIVTTLFGPLIAGQAVHLFPYGTEIDALAQFDSSATPPYSLVKVTPSHLKLLNRSIDLGGTPDLTKALMVGGEALIPSDIIFWQHRFPGISLINHFGPTETTVGCCTFDIAAPVADASSIPIGRPIANTQIYILDTHGEPVPISVIGELYIGGAGVARGYLNQPELTAEKFLVDPFSHEPEARMYRTGDLGRWLPDGNIEFLGRNDNQVKIRGFRIELGEIEARLAEHPEVQETAVVAREDDPGNRRLVAYYTLAQDSEPISPEKLRVHLAAVLPEYMIPAAYVVLDALPLTPNGKLDRKAFPAPEIDAYTTSRYEAPQGDAEKTLAQIWTEVLKLDRVGRHDNFFELGGHSLLAVTLIERMRRSGFNVDVRTLFSTPALSQLASSTNSRFLPIEVPPNLIPSGCDAITPDLLTLIKLSQEEIEKIVATVPGGARNVQDIYPLAPLQGGILFHHLLGGEGDTYLLGVLTSFDSRARLDRYITALQNVIERHDILRTSVLWEGLPEPVQVVWRVAPLQVTEIELDSSTGDAAEQLYTRFNPRRFRIDVESAPLLRLFIAHDRQNEQWLMMMLRHHLAGDHTTLEVMQEEVEKYLLEQSAQLPPPLPFRHLVAQSRLGVSEEEHEAFFQEMLGDVDEPTAPFGFSNVLGDGSDIEEFRHILSRDLSQRLRNSARRVGVSVASLCHLAWARVLSTVSGRDDVVFGTVLFGRMWGGEGADRVMGPFINTLPVRIPIGSQTVEASVKSTQSMLANLLHHEHASLALVQRCSAVPAPAPLFTTILNYRHIPRALHMSSELEAGAYEGMRMLRGEERTNYPITLSVEDFGVEVGLTAQVLSSIGPLRVCQYMHTALESLVHALETAPETPIHTLHVLPNQERHELLYDWNNTRVEYPGDKCVHQMFEDQVAKTPDAVAVVLEDRKLSYGELNCRANRLAHHLRELGVRPDVPVALCVERGFEMVTALLATLKAGGAYVPLDPSYPIERLHFMLEDSAPVVLLTQDHLQTLFSDRSSTLQVINLDIESESWSDRPDTNPEPASVGLTSQHLAYIIYTSGSTGRPKGVMVQHHGVSNYLLWAVAAYVPTDGSIVSSSLSFDATITSVFSPLLCGGPVQLVPERQELDGISRYLSSPSNRGLAKLTPSLLDELGRRLAAENRAALVNTFVIGGESLDPATVRLWREHQPNMRLVNEYGPTETVVGCATYDIPKTRGTGLSIPIGRPIANTQIYILDRHSEPVPVGVAGELYIGGAGVARGYLNRPELTTERFLVDPFSQEPGARMYKTGDLGRWLAGGNIEFLGRNDDQVKIRGFRIELKEIDTRLAEHPKVETAVTIAREDEPGNKRLVAYYTVASTHGPLDVEELRAHLAATLPEYMVPTAYVYLDALPLTSNGKLDRKALPAPEAAAYAKEVYEPPEGVIETMLAAIWTELLRLEQVGRRDNFFSLGGHSLLAVRVISKIRQALNIDVSISELFARPVLADFCQTLERADRSELPPITRVQRFGPLPLSFAQQRLWFLAQMEGGSEAYHMPFSLRLKGHLNHTVLRRVMDRVVTRHETLRTTFALVDGSAVQRIAPPEESHFYLLECDLRERSDAQAELKRLLELDATASFHLEQGPLIRGRLVQLATDEHALMITMHHIVSDGWSIGVLLNEISVLYRAYLLGEEDPLPNLDIQYVDYAVWQRKWIEGRILQQQAEYWKETLAGAPALLEIATDHPRPAQQNYEGAFAKLLLDQEIAAALKQLSKRHGTTLFMTIVTAWAILLSRLSGQQDVIVGSPVANRQRPEIEGLIGFFVNTLALRIDLSGSPTVGELLGRVKAQALAAQENQDIPFEHVVEIMRPTRSLAHSPLFQVGFAWQNAPTGILALNDLELHPLDLPLNRKSKFDLTLFLREANEGSNQQIVGGLEYATSLFEASTIERYLSYLRNLLFAMATDDTQAVDGLRMITDQERQLLLYEWNNTKEGFPNDTYIHHMFESQVEGTPDATAVIFENCKLTYDELNQRANRLAHYLRELGVRPDERVAICVERGPEMIVGLLAILKAGGAYVPLDPSYPIERLNFMVQDAAPVVLLTQANLQEFFGGFDDTISILNLNDPSGWQEAPSTNLDPNAIGLTSRHLAYIIYTSGSTGTPKGVMVEHGGLSNYLQYATAMYVPSGGGVVSSPLSFDATITSLFCPLLCGGPILLIPERQEIDGLFTELRSHRNRWLVKATPSALDAIGRRLALEPKSASVNVFVIGGEILPPSIVRLWRMLQPAVRLVNEYGPTETVVGCATYDIPEHFEPTASIPIGRPIANTQIYILDQYMQPVPIGVVGELYIGGAGVARGYLKCPELTAARFLVDHLARRRAHGYIGPETAVDGFQTEIFSSLGAMTIK